MANRSNSIAPLFLRLALGITFIWAGLGKVTQEMEVQGASAAALANMGLEAVRARAAGAGNLPLDPPQNRTTPADPTADPNPQPSGDTPPAERRAPTKTPDPTPAPSEPLPEPASDPTGTPPPTPREPANPDPTTSPRAPLLMALQSEAAPPAAVPAAVIPERTYSAADFPEPVKVHSLYGIALLLNKSANPAARDDGTSPMPLVPPSIEGQWLIYLAWAAAVTELVGGVLILVGLFGRVAALGLAFTMLTAIWLTQVGPAIQGGNALLGFLPSHGAYEKNAAGDFMFAKLAWQFMLMCASLAVLFAGSGAVSLDRLLFPGKDRGPRDAG